MNVKQTRHCYTIKHKLAVIAYAKQHGNRAAERKYGSPPNGDDKNVEKTRRTKHVFVGEFELSWMSQLRNQ